MESDSGPIEGCGHPHLPKAEDVATRKPRPRVNQAEHFGKLSHPQATPARADPPQSSSGFHLGEPYWSPYGSCLLGLMRLLDVLGERG